MATIKNQVQKSGTPGNDTKRKPLQYSDKSEGQPQLLPIFDNIKTMINQYEKNNFKPRDENPGSYSLYRVAPIEIVGRKFDAISFASLLIQKRYVGFYFFPIYVNSQLAKLLDDGLMKCLKGKTCFHIKDNDEKMLNEISDALETGYQFYSKQGWA